MPFRSEANPEHIAMMKRVLDKHCETHSIAADSVAHEAAARRILYLFGTGVIDETLFAALLTPKSDKP